MDQRSIQSTARSTDRRLGKVNLANHLVIAGKVHDVI